jgi:hypothetical protein
MEEEGTPWPLETGSVYSEDEEVKSRQTKRKEAGGITIKGLMEALSKEGEERRKMGGKATTKEDITFTVFASDGNANKAIASEVIHLVDIDWAGEQRVEHAAGRVGGRACDQAGNTRRIETPLLLQNRGWAATSQQVQHERFVLWDVRQSHVFNGMAESPVANIVDQRRYHQKELFYRLPFRPLVKFLLLYVAKRGFLDGRAGFTYAMLQSIYEYFIVLKTRELEAQ